MLFYKEETYKINKELLSSLVNLLSIKPNSAQTLGLANLIFFNNDENFSSLEDDIVKLDKSNAGIIPMMY